ncbi:MAG TPA: hypothetical protein VMR52_05780 [Dehalococcoidia bacterium]|nr:hypothetical protein [Dehalococcoidia bacterium]
MLEQKKPMSRRTLLRRALIGGTGLAAAFVVGCGDDDDDDDGGGTTTDAPGTSAPAATTAPAAEEPKEFPLIAGWYRGNEVEYYDFGMNTPLASGASVLTAPIYVFITGTDADGNPVFVEGQHNVIDVKPGDVGYSDLWQVNLVTVDETYEPDSIRSKDDIDAAGLAPETVEMFVNCPVVPVGSTLEGGEELVQGWYKGKEVFYPDFGANPPTALPIWAFITGMDAEGNPLFVEGQMNVIDSVPGDEGYSAFWDVNLVTVPGDYEANTLTSASDVLAAGYEITKPGLLVNCPVTVF